MRGGRSFRQRLDRAVLNQVELVALYLAERLIQQLRGTPFEADQRRAIGKLGMMLCWRMASREGGQAHRLARIGR